MEIWKDVVGFENIYLISNLGNVKSLARKVAKIQPNGDIYIHQIKDHILKGEIGKDGYKKVLLGNGINYKKHFFIHRLIAEAFISKVEGKNIINHIDGNKANNKINNLEWCTYSENNKHAYDTGLNPKGENHGMNKFSKKTILEIRKIYVNGSREFGSRSLARKFKMSKTNVLHIVNNKIWKDVI